jgi:hypothetical protein
LRKSSSPSPKRRDDELNNCPWLDKPAKVHDDETAQEIKLLERETATARIILTHKKQGSDSVVEELR